MPTRFASRPSSRAVGATEREQRRTGWSPAALRGPCETDVATCEQRDPEGLYKRSRAGEFACFTGISAPCEAPTGADLMIETSHLSIEESIDQLLRRCRSQVGSDQVDIDRASALRS